MDQIEFYCSKIEELTGSLPHVAASIEKCALEAVTSLCQVQRRHMNYTLYCAKIKIKPNNMNSWLIHNSVIFLTM